MGVLFTAAFSVLVVALSYVVWRVVFRKQPGNGSPEMFGFFHPYCSGGGGGERVLWKMIQLLQSQGKSVVIYTIDPPDTDEAKLRQDAERRFDVHISKPVQLISLEQYKDFLLPSPYLSLVLESYGTMKLARQALKRIQPDVFCDTTGCAFTFLVARWMLPPTARILAYVHYPTISTDMMLFEWQQGGRSKKLWKTVLKLVYYWMFAVAYGIVGSLADLVMVNSTWTYHHIASLWRFSKEIHIVYPPCRVPSTNAEKTQEERQRQNTIVSIGQFRPEKDHPLQVKSLARLLEQHPEHKGKVKLLLIGSCRNEGDQKRVESLKKLASELQVQNHVEFSINPPYSDLQQSMFNASIGIHTMRQEHFGIGIVEMMAAGLLTIAHNSGGPKTDIVEAGVSGFLATTVDEYATAIHQALALKDPQGMRQSAQESATRFSDQVFDVSLEHVLSKSLLSLDKKKN
jgi:alpha-1,2-mannosyltransferase